jgi:type I restriction enzyme S subunit
MKYKPYPKYKDSGVEWLGEIPEGWGLFLGKRLFSNKRISQHDNDEQLTASQKHGVIPQRLFMEKAEQKVALALGGTDSFKHVDVDDFVISLRSFEGGIERAHYTGCITPAYTILQRDTRCLPTFWAHLFKSQAFISMLSTLSESLRDGKAINYESFARALLPLPPLPVQKKIAAFLDKETARIDTLVKEKEALIALLKEKRQALISHAVTRGLSELVSPDDPEFGQWARPVKFKDSGVEWLGEIPEGWEAWQMKRDLEFITSGSRGWAEFYSDEGVVFLRIGNLSRESIELDLNDIQRVSPPENKESIRTLVKTDDLLVSITADIGSVAVVHDLNENSYISQHLAMCRFRQNTRILSKWAAYTLKSNIGRMQFSCKAYGGTKIQLSLDDVKELLLTIPSILEQAGISNYLYRETKKFDFLISETESSIILLQEHRAALITNAVTGKINVEGCA